jgi:hypothetical protein
MASSIKEQAGGIVTRLPDLPGGGKEKASRKRKTFITGRSKCTGEIGDCGAGFDASPVCRHSFPRFPADSHAGRIHRMAQFYLLPPRTIVGEALSWFLRDWLPGMPRVNDCGVDLADAIQLVAAQRPDMYLIFREDLPDAEDPAQALRDGFGAEPGDEVFELRMTGPGEVRSRSWRLSAMSAA